MHGSRCAERIGSAGRVYCRKDSGTTSCADKAHYSHCRGSVFITNGAIVAGCADVKKNVDKTEIADGVINGFCINSIGYKDDKGDIELAAGLNGRTAASRMTNYMIWDVEAAGTL